MVVVAPEHKGNLLNSAFATELGDFIADNRIDAWIFGLSHDNTRDYDSSYDYDDYEEDY